MIGVKLGDGYATKQRRTIRGYNNVGIGLKVKDREFAVEFSRCLAMVLGRPPKKPRYMKTSKEYAVEVGSETLYQLLKKPVDLDRLKKYIEHCDRCTASFLRGFFDSEGSVDERGYVLLHNTDLRLLEYIKDLLRCLDIESTGPKPRRQQGKTFYDSKMLKRYTRKKECYYIRIRTNSSLRFYRKVGLTIRRKQKHLENYLRRRQAKPLPLLPPLYTDQIHEFGPGGI